MALPEIDYEKLSIQEDLKPRLRSMQSLKRLLDEECGVLNTQINEIEDTLQAVSLGVAAEIVVHVGQDGGNGVLSYHRGEQGWRLYFDGHVLQECRRSVRIHSLAAMAELLDKTIDNATDLYNRLKEATS